MTIRTPADEWSPPLNQALTGADGSFDVNGDSVDEDVKINLTMVRG